MVTEFAPYAIGIAAASVCSTLSLRETTRRLNEEHPSGVAPWFPSRSATFRSGDPNPCSCERNPETHTHYLFEC